MSVSLEFSKYAKNYDELNIIQNQVVQKLLSLTTNKPKNILDLGCGSGAVCKSITWDYDSFVGVDFAKGMLELHPKSSKIHPIYGDFNDETLFETLQTYSFDYIFSSSALQWAEDLDFIFKKLKELNTPLSLAIFTSNTFKTLNKTASLNPILKSAKEIDTIQKKYLDLNFEVVEYKLEFNSTRDMFKYIKKSGVSGSRQVLNYKAMKQLMKQYPLNYLEFEVAFISSL